MLLLFIIVLLVYTLGSIIFIKVIKQKNYELNFLESILYSLSILILVPCSTLRYDLVGNYLKIILASKLSILLIIYFPILVLVYYLIRYINLKKYIPMKNILLYALMFILSVIVFGIFEHYANNIGILGNVVFYIVYFIYSDCFILLMLIMNLIFLIIKKCTKDKKEYKNINYKLSKFSLINIILIMLVGASVLLVDNINTNNYNKLIEKEQAIVLNYLNRKYPNYNFEIVKTYEESVECENFIFCKTVFRNDLKSDELGKSLTIDVYKSNLEIKEEDFDLGN